MTNLTKETLEKTLATVKEEMCQIESGLTQILNSVKNPTLENFCINDIGRDYWSLEEELYQIQFKHMTEDVSFNFSQGKGLDRVSWSSWSYSQIKAEEKEEVLERSIKYIIAVQEMLELNKNEEKIKSFMNEVVEEYVNTYLPLRKQYNKIASQKEELEQAIRSIDIKNEAQTAIDYMVGKNRIVRQPYTLSKNTNLYQINIEHDGKRYFILINGRKKTVNELDILSMYKHTQKFLKNWEMEEEGTVYYKYANEIDSEEKRNISKEDKIIITQEEYRKLSR
jgi:hypothetical protein